MRAVIAAVFTAGLLVLALAPAPSCDASRPEASSSGACIVASLTKQLQSSDPQARREAIRALAELGPTAGTAAPALIAALPDWRLRRGAAKALVKIGPQSSTELIYGLRTDNDKVREAITGVLRKIGGQIVPQLHRAARHANPSIRNGAIEALGHVKPPSDETIALLAETLRRRNVRLEFRETLRPSHRIEQVLVLNDDADESRAAAAITLGRLGSRSLPFLIDALHTQKRELPSFIVSGAPDTLCQFVAGDLPWFLWNYPAEFQAWMNDQFSRLRSELQDPHSSTRRLALLGIGELGGAQYGSLRFRSEDLRLILPEVIGALKDPKIAIRLGAADFLGRIGSAARDAIPALIGAVHDRGYVFPLTREHSSHSVKRYAVRALMNIGGTAENRLRKDSLPILMADLRDGDYQIRLAAASALENMGELAESAIPQVMELVRKGVESESQAERSGAETTTRRRESSALDFHDASSALREMGPAAAVALGQWLVGDDPHLRAQAVHMLWRMGGNARPAVPALIRALDDPKPEVRRYAMETLGYVGRAAIVASADLHKALADKDTATAFAAANALSRIEPMSLEPIRFYARMLLEEKSPRQLLELLRKLRQRETKAQFAAPYVRELLRRPIPDDEYEGKNAAQLRRDAALTLGCIDPDEKADAVLALHDLITKGHWQGAVTLAEIAPEGLELQENVNQLPSSSSFLRYVRRQISRTIRAFSPAWSPNC